MKFKQAIALTGAGLLLSGAMPSVGWNLEAKTVNALRFERNGTIQFTLFNEGSEGAEYICDESKPTVPVEGGGQWFVIKSCKVGKGKGNKSASTSCLASVDRMAEMLLEAKLKGIPVHVQHELCVVTETALKPLPGEEPGEPVEPAE
jgi:hypothetical protein